MKTMTLNKGFCFRALLLVGMVLTYIGVQAKEIQGKVVDNEGKAVHGASVVVMSLPDSVFACTAVTDEAGVVRFDTGAVDSVLVTVQMLGYERFQGAVSCDFTASLEPTSTQLQEVVVVAQPEFRSEAGKLVFTPGDLVKRVNNAQDILQYVPMVMITGNNIEVLGAPRTIVYVNGRPPRGMFADIKKLISSLPPSCIKRVEVIKNRGASVAGSYDGAIVNIVMTYPWEGFAGIVNASAFAQHDLLTPTGSIGLYYTKGKWSFSYSGGFSSWGEDTHKKNYYEYKPEYQQDIKSYTNDIHYRRWTSIISNHFTANYNFTDRSTLGLGVGFSFIKTTEKNITTTTYTPTEGEAFERRSAVRDTIPFGNPNVGANLFYSLQTDDKGSNLDVVLGYYVSQKYTHTGMFYPDSTLYRNQSNYGVGFGGEARYQHLFSRRVQLNVGAGFVGNTTDDALDFYEQSNRFIYKENLLHAFGEISFPWQRTSFVVGLRVETEFNTGEVRTTGDSFRRNGTAILPDIRFDWQMPWHGQSLSASVSRGVRRPWLSDLNPFRIWTTENAYTEGNPYLKNYYEWTGSLAYMCVENIMFSASYTKSTGSRNIITLPDEQQRMATKYYDGPGEYRISAGINYSKELLSFWSINTSVDYSFYHSKFGIEGIKIKSIFNMVNFSLKSIFNFSKRYGLFGTIYYSLGSPFKSYNDSRGAWRNNLSVNIRKDWKNCSLSLNVSRIIPTHPGNYNFNSDIYIARYKRGYYGPSFTLNFRYVFGNKKVRAARSRDAGVDSRLN